MSTQLIRKSSNIVGGTIILVGLAALAFNAWSDPNEPVRPDDMDNFRAEQSALLTQVGQFAWGSERSISKTTGVVFSGDLVLRTVDAKPLNSIISAQRELGWTSCTEPSAGALATMAKGRYRFSIFVSQSELHAFRVSCSLRRRQNDSDCVPSSV